MPLIAAALMALALSAPVRAATEMPVMAAVTVEPFTHGVVRGVLVLPRTSPRGAVVILQDATGADGRSARYIDQLLGASLAVLDIFEHEEDAAAVEAAVEALADRLGQRGAGVLAFGTGAALTVNLPSVTARALLYPGCGESLTVGLAGTSGPLLLAHGGLDPANPVGACTGAAMSLSQSGRAVRHLVYERAGYAWDHPALGLEARFLLPRPDGPGHVEGLPWPQLAVMSSSDVANFFSRSLAP